MVCPLSLTLLLNVFVMDGTMGGGGGSAAAGLPSGPLIWLRSLMPAVRALPACRLTAALKIDPDNATDYITHGKTMDYVGRYQLSPQVRYAKQLAPTPLGTTQSPRQKHQQLPWGKARGPCHNILAKEMHVRPKAKHQAIATGDPATRESEQKPHEANLQAAGRSRASPPKNILHKRIHLPGTHRVP